MSPDQFRSSLRAVPFVPFRIHLVDQRSFDVPHPEFVMLVPSGRTAGRNRYSCSVSRMRRLYPPSLEGLKAIKVAFPFSSTSNHATIV